MFLIVLLTLFQYNNAVDFTVSARDGNQNFTMFEGDVPIVLKVYDIREDIRGGDCSGTCTINTRTTLLTTCNLIDIPGTRHLNILIQNRAQKLFSGAWQCNFSTRGLTSSDQPLEYFNFNMLVKEVDLTSIPAGLLPHGDVQFNITSPKVVNNFTLEEGNQTVEMFITLEQFRDEKCDGWCEMNKKENINTTLCSMQNVEQSSILQLIFQPLKVTKSHAGSWKCYLKYSNNIGIPLTFEMNMAVHSPDDSTDVWLYVAIAAGVLVILAIIIGQTICIIHFKSKAKEAEINKNLTPNKNTDDSPDVRYVKKNSSNGEVRESVIYEALDTVIGGAPIPPPIETLPVMPKPGRMSRSFSHNNLSVSPEERITNTSPRMPKNRQDQGKFNTVDRIKSLERIRKRPPMPTPDEIYEVMAPGDAPEPAKPGWFKTKTVEQSPLLEKQKKTLFGQSQPLPPDPRVPASPKASRKPAVPLPGSSRMQAGPGPMPGSGRPPVGGAAIMGAMPMLPSMIAAANLKPVKHRPFEAPSEGYRMPPPPENPRARAFRTQDTPRPEMQDHPRTNAFRPQHSPRMPEMQNHPRMPNTAFRQDQPRMPFRMPERLPQPARVEESPRMPGSGFRMPDRNDQPYLPKPGPVPLTKPKPPVPLPEPEPIESEHEPESYYGSSDEEFDCYDVLPEYRIYGNAPPKKIQ